MGKIPWRREWLPAPVCLPAEVHGWGSLAGYKSMRSQRVGHHRATKLQKHKFLFHPILMQGGDGMSPDTRFLPYLVLPTVPSTLFLWSNVQLTRSFGKPAMCLAPAGLLLQVQVLPLLRAAFPATSWPGCVLISLGPGRTVFKFMFPLDCIFREHQSSDGVSAVYFVV